MADKESMNEYLQSFSIPAPRSNAHLFPSLILLKGLWFEGRTKSDEYQSAKAWSKREKPKIKECFYNAHAFCRRHQEVRYFEGYMATTPGTRPVLHAWNVLPDGRVIDFTAEAMECHGAEVGIPLNITDVLYRGLDVPLSFLNSRNKETGMCESVAHLYYASEIKSL